MRLRPFRVSFQIKIHHRDTEDTEIMFLFSRRKPGPISAMDTVLRRYDDKLLVRDDLCGLCASVVNSYTVATVPKITVLCDDSTPPLPCAIAVAQSATWRAPHSWRSCRVASINRNSPYMPGWQ